jgi:hypothetical protein
MKKYKVIAKIGNNENGTAKTVKYNVNNLLLFTNFLDKQFPSWTWFNVYDCAEKVQLDNFTKYSRPTSRFLSQR